MADKHGASVVKIIELLGVSKESWEDAAQNAVMSAAKTLDNITGVEVLHYTGTVENGRIVEYKATVKVAFGVTER